MEPRRRNPWWIPPFLGRVPEGLDARHLRLLGLMALGLAFEQYNLSLVNSAIQQIADDLGMGMGDIGRYTGAVRLGGFFSFLLVPLADRLGRRRLFLVSLLGMSITALATAVVQTPFQYALVQLVARAFLLTTAALAVVIVVEEFPAAHRGWGLGMLVAVSAFGYGVGVGLFAAVDSLPFGWRALYVPGVLTLFLIPFFRRELRETARFESHRAASGGSGGAGVRGWLAPVLRLARTHPVRAAAVGAAGLFGAMGSIAVFQYLSPFVQTVHGWRPWQYSLMVISGGLLGMAGNVVGGRLADRLGRRWVGLAAYGLYPASVAAFYHGPAWALVLAWVFIVFLGTAGDVVTRALSTELFPTSHRSTAMGWLTLLQTAGWTLGLVLVGSGTAVAGDIGRTVSWMALVAALAGVALWTLPESGRRELEEVSGEAFPRPAGEG